MEHTLGYMPLSSLLPGLPIQQTEHNHLCSELFRKTLFSVDELCMWVCAFVGIYACKRIDRISIHSVIPFD